jgi:hypothetical protein
MSNYSTRYDGYHEAAALQQLLETIEHAMARQLELWTAGHHEQCDEFTITVGGIQTAFDLGGPQVEALYKFVEHIAGENFYEVDIPKCKVISHLM